MEERKEIRRRGRKKKRTGRNMGEEMKEERIGRRKPQIRAGRCKGHAKLHLNLIFDPISMNFQTHLMDNSPDKSDAIPLYALQSEILSVNLIRDLDFRPYRGKIS